MKTPQNENSLIIITQFMQGNKDLLVLLWLFRTFSSWEKAYPKKTCQERERERESQKNW